MPTLAETVTRVLDDLSRPEDELGDIAQREILSAIAHYGSERFAFNERIITATISATNTYLFADLIGAASTSIADILRIDNIKITYSGREYELEQENWPRLFQMDSIGTTASQPDFWATFNKSVRFYPTPNTSISAQITAHVRLTTLDGSTYVENEWLNEGEELIRSRACRMICMRKLDDFEKANMFMGLEADALKRLRQDAATVQSTGRLAAND
jgi:hypothetical protein